MRSPVRLPKGFTLVEMLVVAAILAVVAAMATSSMHLFIQKSHLRGSAARLLDAITVARSEAVLRNSRVTLCPSLMHETGQPVCAGDYARGWIVFANADRDHTVDPGADEVLQIYQALPASVGLTNRKGTASVATAIHYLPDGSSRRNLTLMLCSLGAPSLPSLSLILNIVGRPRMQTGWGECPEGAV